MSPSLGVELGSVVGREWLSLRTAVSGLEEVEQGRVCLPSHVCMCTRRRLLGKLFLSISPSSSRDFTERRPVLSH